MRLFLALPLLGLAACQVSTDDANDQVSVAYNEDVAENAAAEVGAAAREAANEVGEAARDVKNEVEKVDVDIDVKTDGTEANANAN